MFTTICIQLQFAKEKICVNKDLEVHKKIIANCYIVKRIWKYCFNVSSFQTCKDVGERKIIAKGRWRIKMKTHFEWFMKLDGLINFLSAVLYVEILALDGVTSYRRTT